MGATPRAALLSLALPDDMSVGRVSTRWWTASARTGRPASRRAGRRQHHAVAGPLMVDVTAIGSVHRRRRPDARRREGRAMSCSSAARSAPRRPGLHWLRSDGAARPSSEPPRRSGPGCDASAAIAGPSRACGSAMLLGRNRAASACIDLSDGLADAVRQLAEASGAGRGLTPSGSRSTPGHGGGS